HASFLAANVPAFFWRQAGTARYQRTHHTQHDTFDAANPDYQRHSSLVVAIAAYGIANLDHLFSRQKLRPPRPLARAGNPPAPWPAQETDARLACSSRR